MLARALKTSRRMAEQDSERRKHWTGRERARLREYQREWEIRAKAPEDERKDRSYGPRSPIDPPKPTGEK
jgi:hypothetical protein